MDLEGLMTEQGNPLSGELDKLSSLEVVTLMNSEDAKVAASIYPELPNIAKAVEVIASSLKSGGRLIYIGCGTSGRLGILDASECAVTFGVEEEKVIGVIAGGREAVLASKEFVEDDPEAAVVDLANISLCEKDVLVGLSASGRTPYVIGGLTYASSLKCSTIGICCNKDTRLDDIASIVIAPVVGPEVLTGSTRMKAGTAQKMVLNMLSTGAMVRMGKCYGNLMVDMNGSSCDKLKDRSRRIIGIRLEPKAATGCTAQQAADLAVKTGHRTKIAILMFLVEMNLVEAEALLVRSDGNVRKALELARVK